MCGNFQILTGNVPFELENSGFGRTERSFGNKSRFLSHTMEINVKNCRKYSVKQMYTVSRAGLDGIEVF